MHNQENCCNKLFADFKFQNIVDADPPEVKGVYVIRIKKRGIESFQTATHNNVPHMGPTIPWMELEYGWKTCNNPKEEENKIKEKYKKIHHKLPALVER